LEQKLELARRKRKRETGATGEKAAREAYSPSGAKDGQRTGTGWSERNGYFQLPPTPPEPHNLIKQPTWLAAIQDG